MAMTRRRILALIIVLAALALVVTARVPLDRGDSLTVALNGMYLTGLQSLVLLGAWIVALASLGARRDRAACMLGAGVYALTMGVAFVPTEPLLYLSHLGAEALMLGAGLTAAGVLCLAGARPKVALCLAALAPAWLGAANSVTELNAADGSEVGTFAIIGLAPRALAFDGVNMWVTNTTKSSVSKL
jgi:hypothetical protein